MKKNSVLNFVLLTVLMVACQGEKGNFLPELKLKIPEVLEQNEEANIFLKSNQKMLNDYAITFERIVVACSPLVTKEESELQNEEKELLGEYMMNLTETLGMFAVSTAQMEAMYTAVEYSLEEEQLPIFNQMMSILNQRVLLINERYANFGIPKDQLDN